MSAYQPSETTVSSTINCDVLVVGGGVNGAGIARDLAGRGWSVVMCEQHDLANHTSSASTKLIHGGLRYLQYGDFRLVRKALIEREGLLRGAPHIMWPLQFVLPHEPNMRPAWMIRLGLWLYDHLGPRDFLPASSQVALQSHVAGAALQAKFQRGFVYADGWVDDSRLVVLCTKDAQDKGARIFTRTFCEQLQPNSSGWQALLVQHDPHTKALVSQFGVQARLVVNAAGPWADQLQSMLQPAVAERNDAANMQKLKLVKGSHIVVPRLFDHAYAYILQESDGRIVFAIPYEGHFTLVGTTDEAFEGDPSQTQIGEHEIQYLCNTIRRYFRQPITAKDVKWSFSGVRPLLDDDRGDASAITRDYRIDHHSGTSPWVTPWGGKITTFRKLAEQTGHWVGKLLQEDKPAWSFQASLPGGDLLALIHQQTDPVSDMALFQQRLSHDYPWIDRVLMQRWCRQFGSNVFRLLEGVSSLADLGIEVAPCLFEHELRYLRDDEWAQTGEDVLWRRTKLGLHYTSEQRQAVADWMEFAARLRD